MHRVYPSKEVAIIADSIEGTSITDYACAIAKLSSKSAIRFVSRISNDRVCVYLDSRQSALQLLCKHSTIVVKDTIVGIRPLISSSKRIIFSGVSPSIPNEYIEKFLADSDIKATSKLSYLRAAIREPGFSHVLSFRRQIYIDAGDLAKIPESFVIYHDDICYRIFLSIEKVGRSLRKRQGHVTKRCSINDKSTETIVGNTVRSNEATKVIDSDTKNNGINGDDDTCTKKNTVVNSLVETVVKSIKERLKNSSYKRCLSELSRTPSPSAVENINDEDQTCCNTEHRVTAKSRKLTNDDANKKPKRSRSLNRTIGKIDDTLKLAKPAFDHAENNFVLSYNQFQSFLENAFGIENPVAIAKEYTADIKALTDMIKTVYPLLIDRSIKNRLHRLKRKLEKEHCETLISEPVHKVQTKLLQIGCLIPTAICCTAKNSPMECK